jgi:hypothetical protein
MAQFKVGDQVRLKAAMPMAKAGRDIEEKTVGQVIEVNGETYVVQFTDSKTAVEGITDAEIEADK